MKASDCILFSGGAPGAEAEFGACAERHGVEEVNFTFDGHKIVRHRGVRVLNHEELQNGDVSLEYVSRLMQRRYSDAPTIRKVLQTMWYQVNSGQEIWVIGTILDDKTVRGGTGWGAEFAKAVQQETSRVRSGAQRLVLVERRGLGARRRQGRPAYHAPALLPARARASSGNRRSRPSRNSSRDPSCNDSLHLTPCTPSELRHEYLLVTAI